MNSPVPVCVSWSTGKFGQLPTANTYTTIAKFDEDGPSWPRRAWSIQLEFPDNELLTTPSVVANARFLMPNGPWERLVPGRKFELYEGTTRTATVTVL